MISTLACIALVTVGRLHPQQEGAGSPPAAAAAPAEEKSPGRATLEFVPNIVLVTVDTLRRDHLGCYGYRRPTSPRIDALAAESVLFERVLASTASTFPSHLAMLTGLYPFQHGKTSNRSAAQESFRSGPGCASVAVALRDAGWTTAAFLSSVVLHRRTGICEGFTTAETPARGGELPFRASHTTDLALAWLEEQPAAPFFLWVHYFDTHEPNRPPRAFAERFQTDDALREWMAHTALGPTASKPEFTLPFGTAERFFDAPLEVNANKDVALDRADLEELFNRYDASVAYVDSQIGRLVDALRAKSLWERTIFVFTADHGQALGEHDHFGHLYVYDVNTSVPLVVHFPAGAVEQPARHGELVSHIDLMPTLLARFEHTGLEAFLAQVEGRDVFSGGPARPWSLSQEASETRRRTNPLVYALHSERWKLMVGEGGPTALYDQRGAGEAQDVLANHPDVADEMSQVLAKLLQRVPARAAGDATTPEEERRMLDELEKLGYGGDDEDD